MLKYVLIYLWIYIAIYCAVEAGEDDEHVHIKLHMPKTGTRKAGHRHHIRRKKNPPPFAAPLHHQHHTHATGPSATHDSGPGASFSHIYHESPHNYVTGAQQLSSSSGLSPHHLHHGHHMKNLATSLSSMTHLQQAIGGQQHHQQQQLLDSEFYANADDTLGNGGDTSSSNVGLNVNGDYGLNEYLSKNFASFPEPTTFEAEIITPQTNDELDYYLQQQQQQRDSRGKDTYHRHRQHAPPPTHDYESAVADVIAANHELEEDNEILGSFGKTTSPYKGFSTLKAMKNEHLLKQIMQEQEEQQQRASFPYQPEITNSIGTMAMLRANNAKYHDDKLHSAAVTAAADDVMETMNTYEDVDVVTRHTDGQRGERAGDLEQPYEGIKALTVDDIWSQLQRTYLNKYTPQAQPSMMEQVHPAAPSRKQKRNSQKTKTRKQHHQKQQQHPQQQQHHQHHQQIRSTASTNAAAGVKGLNYENNYYNQEHQPKYSTFYDSQHKPAASSYTVFSPATSSSYSSSLSSTERDLFDARATTATRPYHNFETSYEAANAARYGEDSADEELATFINDSSRDEDDDNEDDEVALHRPHGLDASAEETMFSLSPKKFGNNRSHRHSQSSVAYGNAKQLNNNPLNYRDLYASSSTPIEATIATQQSLPLVSTYHPNTYGAAAATTRQQQSLLQAPTLSHESTSYQWREQQHYPGPSYPHQSYQQTTGQQYNNRPQHQQLQQQQQQHQYQPQTSNALRLPKATVASSITSTSSSSSLSQQHPLLSTFPSAASPTLSSNDFTLPSSLSSSSSSSTQQQQQQQHQQRYKKRKNRLKSKRNRIVVT